MRIVLLGFMGCGKTTIGMALAEKLGLEFADLDKFIEAATNTSIVSIFKTRGEEEFRKLEQEALAALLNKDELLLATGGGTPCFFNNMEIINKNSVSIYLKMSADALFDRLLSERSTRPLIEDLEEKELKKYISDLLIIREPHYNKAHYKIKAKELQAGALADFLKQERLNNVPTHFK